MKEKTFVVTHRRARAPLTITGKTLEDALAKEGLSPSLWEKIGGPREREEQEADEDTGDARPEDY